MANPWCRLYSEFAHDPKVQIMPEAMQRRLIMLFCLRCSETLETLHETELAFHLRISDAELEETRALFLAKGFIDESWNLLNWDTRQFASDSSTERVRKHRETKRAARAASETLHSRSGNALDTDADADTESVGVGVAQAPPSPNQSETVSRSSERMPDHGDRGDEIWFGRELLTQTPAARPV